jgi:penicillin-binding protein 2
LKAQELLAGRRGAIVMMEPNTGAILAMESSPSYDPNLFVTGISSANYWRCSTIPPGRW